jgi:DNA-binding transcriptional MerR regulator
MTDLASSQQGGRRLAKSPDAFRTISEVAEELNVPQHVLRFWETKFSQIKPLKRGGGRRYYRPEDVELLRRIRSLLYGEGYTIKGVQKVLREHGGRALPAEPAPPKPAAEPPPAPPVAAQVVPMPPRPPVAPPPAAPVAPAPAQASMPLAAPAMDTRRRAALESALADLTEVQALLNELRR